MNDTQFENLLRQALCPEIDPDALTVHGRQSGKGNHMNIKNLMKKACIAAAAVLLLTTTAYAADSLNIKTLVSGSSSKVYQTVEQAEEKAGFEINAKEKFANGYSFIGARVDETKALDMDDRVRLTYNEIRMDLENAVGERLSLSAYRQNDEIPDSDLTPDQTRRIGDVIVSYRVDHYKFVPADYELTEADEAWMKQPGNFLSYGSKEVGETKVAFLTWEKDGVCYILMDSDAQESPDSLFSMADELIHSGT